MALFSTRGFRSRLLGTVTATALASGSLLVLAAPAQAGSRWVTEPFVVTMNGDVGSTAQGTSRTWRSGGVEKLSVQGDSSSDPIHLSIVDAEGFASTGLAFAPPAGQKLTAGTTYENATRAPFNGDSPGISASAFHGTCEPVVGRFTVLDIADDLSRMHIVYELQCPYSTSAGTFGEVHIGQAEDTGVHLAQTRVTWPTQAELTDAAEVAVTVVNPTAEPVAIAGARVTGDTDFGVHSTDCATIAAQGSCVVRLGFTPSTVGAHNATLTVSEASGTTHTLPLSGTGEVQQIYVKTWAQSGSWYRAGTKSFSVRNSTISYNDAGWRGVEIRVNDPDDSWRFTFRPPAGELLQAGRTYTDVVDVSFGDGAKPGINVDSGSGLYVNGSGSFTIHDIEYSGNQMRRLSATFRLGGTNEGALLGTVAWRTAAGQPLPGVVGVAPEPVAALTATTKFDETTLKWDKPLTPDWDSVIVRGASGATAPKTPTDGFEVYTGRGTSKKLTGGRIDGTGFAFAVFVKDKEGLFSKATTTKIYGSAVSLKLSTSKTGYGFEVVASGKLTDARTKKALSGRKVELWIRRPGKETWYCVESQETAYNGTYEMDFYPDHTYDVYVFHRGPGEYAQSGDRQYLGAGSAAKRVTVTMGVAAAVDRSSGRLGTTFTIATAVGPTSAGKSVSLQRLVDGKWKTVATKQLFKSKATLFDVRPSKRGTHVYRLYKAAQGEYAAGTSQTLKIKVT